jgi:signal peptidase I
VITQFKKYAIVFIALSLALFCRIFIVAVYKIPTESMAPTMLPGDFILGSQVSYGLRFPWSQNVWFKATPKKGDLIVFSFKSKPSISYIKRVAAVEGEEALTLNGPIKVGPGQVFVLSDNRDVLEDSRDLGLVSIEQIESQAKVIWFSFEKHVRWDRIFTKL